MRPPAMLNVYFHGCRSPSQDLLQLVSVFAIFRLRLNLEETASSRCAPRLCYAPTPSVCCPLSSLGLALHLSTCRSGEEKGISFQLCLAETSSWSLTLSDLFLLPGLAALCRTGTSFSRRSSLCVGTASEDPSEASALLVLSPGWVNKISNTRGGRAKRAKHC